MSSMSTCHDDWPFFYSIPSNLYTPYISNLMSPTTPSSFAPPNQQYSHDHYKLVPLGNLTIVPTRILSTSRQYSQNTTNTYNPYYNYLSAAYHSSHGGILALIHAYFKLPSNPPGNNLDDNGTKCICIHNTAFYLINGTMLIQALVELITNFPHIALEWYWHFLPQNSQYGHINQQMSHISHTISQLSSSSTPQSQNPYRSALLYILPIPIKTIHYPEMNSFLCDYLNATNLTLRANAESNGDRIDIIADFKYIYTSQLLYQYIVLMGAALATPSDDIADISTLASYDLTVDPQIYINSLVLSVLYPTDYHIFPPIQHINHLNPALPILNADILSFLRSIPKPPFIFYTAPNLSSIPQKNHTQLLPIPIDTPLIIPATLHPSQTTESQYYYLRQFHHFQCGIVPPPSLHYFVEQPFPQHDFTDLCEFLKMSSNRPENIDVYQFFRLSAITPVSSHMSSLSFEKLLKIPKNINESQKFISHDEYQNLFTTIQQLYSSRTLLTSASTYIEDSKFITDKVHINENIPLLTSPASQHNIDWDAEYRSLHTNLQHVLRFPQSNTSQSPNTTISIINPTMMETIVPLQNKDNMILMSDYAPGINQSHRIRAHHHIYDLIYQNNVHGSDELIKYVILNNCLTHLHCNATKSSHDQPSYYTNYIPPNLFDTNELCRCWKDTISYQNEVKINTLSTLHIDNLHQNYLLPKAFSHYNYSVITTPSQLAASSLNLIHISPSLLCEDTTSSVVDWYITSFTSLAKFRLVDTEHNVDLANMIYHDMYQIPISRYLSPLPMVVAPGHYPSSELSFFTFNTQTNIATVDNDLRDILFTLYAKVYLNLDLPKSISDVNINQNHEIVAVLSQIPDIAIEHILYSIILYLLQYEFFQILFSGITYKNITSSGYDKISGFIDLLFGNQNGKDDVLLIFAYHFIITILQSPSLSHFIYHPIKFDKTGSLDGSESNSLTSKRSPIGHMVELESRLMYQSFFKSYQYFSNLHHSSESSMHLILLQSHIHSSHHITTLYNIALRPTTTCLPPINPCTWFPNYIHRPLPTNHDDSRETKRKQGNFEDFLSRVHCFQNKYDIIKQYTDDKSDEDLINDSSSYKNSHYMETPQPSDGTTSSPAQSFAISNTPSVFSPFPEHAIQHLKAPSQNTLDVISNYNPEHNHNPSAYQHHHDPIINYASTVIRHIETPPPLKNLLNILKSNRKLNHTNLHCYYHTYPEFTNLYEPVEVVVEMDNNIYPHYLAHQQNNDTFSKNQIAFKYLPYDLLQPTQQCVSYDVIRDKVVTYLSSIHRYGMSWILTYLFTHPIPVILNNNDNKYYVIDHHHIISGVAAMLTTIYCKISSQLYQVLMKIQRKCTTRHMMDDVTPLTASDIYYFKVINSMSRPLSTNDSLTLLNCYLILLYKLMINHVVPLDVQSQQNQVTVTLPSGSTILFIPSFIQRNHTQYAEINIFDYRQLLFPEDIRLASNIPIDYPTDLHQYANYLEMIKYFSIYLNMLQESHERFDNNTWDAIIPTNATFSQILDDSSSDKDHAFLQNSVNTTNNIAVIFTNPLLLYIFRTVRCCMIDIFDYKTYLNILLNQSTQPNPIKYKDYYTLINQLSIKTIHPIISQYRCNYFKTILFWNLMITTNRCYLKNSFYVQQTTAHQANTHNESNTAHYTKLKTAISFLHDDRYRAISWFVRHPYGASHIASLFSHITPFYSNNKSNVTHKSTMTNNVIDLSIITELSSPTVTSQSHYIQGYYKCKIAFLEFLWGDILSSWQIIPLISMFPSTMVHFASLSNETLFQHTCNLEKNQPHYNDHQLPVNLKLLIPLTGLLCRLPQCSHLPGYLWFLNTPNLTYPLCNLETNIPSNYKYFVNIPSFTQDLPGTWGYINQTVIHYLKYNTLVKMKKTHIFTHLFQPNANSTTADLPQALQKDAQSSYYYEQEMKAYAVYLLYRFHSYFQDIYRYISSCDKNKRVLALQFASYIKHITFTCYFYLIQNHYPGTTCFLSPESYVNTIDKDITNFIESKQFTTDLHDLKKNLTINTNSLSDDHIQSTKELDRQVKDLVHQYDHSIKRLNGLGKIPKKYNMYELFIEIAVFISLKTTQNPTKIDLTDSPEINPEIYQIIKLQIVTYYAEYIAQSLIDNVALLLSHTHHPQLD